MRPFWRSFIFRAAFRTCLAFSINGNISKNSSKSNNQRKFWNQIPENHKFSGLRFHSFPPILPYFGALGPHRARTNSREITLATNQWQAERFHAWKNKRSRTK
jgi:hypothetical protein